MMKVKNIELRGDAYLEELLLRILASFQEELIVAFGKTSFTKSGNVFLIQEVELADETYITRSYEGLKWDARLTAQWVRKAEQKGFGITLIHAHGNTGAVGFSPTDLATKERILQHFGRYLPQQASGYVVVGRNDFVGDFIYKGKNLSLALIRSAGCPIVKRNKTPLLYKTSPYHHRQDLVLGEEATAKLRNATVGLVGLGGAGSMVAQQLAHLKVGRIILIDGDLLEDSNVSRVVGSTPQDVGKQKTYIARRMIHKIDPEISITRIDDFIPTPKIYKELKEADVIISCVDKVEARKALTSFCKRYLVPVIDVGVTIRKKNNVVENINGQVVRMMVSNRCLKCLGIISSALEKQEEIQNYGAAVKNPQVITYNGVLASLAVGEMLKLITGIADSTNDTVMLLFDGIKGTVEKTVLPEFICDICKSQYAQGDPSSK